jgi:glucokinase
MILTGDIGGTKTLLALHDDDGRVAVRRQYPSRDAESFDALVGRFLDEAAPATPHKACFGIAGPVMGDHVKVTHLPWQIDAKDIAARFGIARVQLLNDFAAAAYGIEQLAPDDLVTLQAGEPLRQRPKVVIGAGTGLGLAYVLGDSVLSGEGGHCAFAPGNEIEAALWNWLHLRLGRVEVEHVVSGRGLAHAHEFLLERQPAAEPDARDAPATEDRAASIARRALKEADALSLAAVDLFIGCYGALAGDHALAVLARGGVYLTGGIAPKLLPRLTAGGFLAAFNSKGRWSEWARLCPVHVVTNPDLPLIGAARFATRAVARS